MFARLLLASSFLSAAATALAQAPAPTAAAKRNLQIDDLFRLRTVDNPVASPDGKWVYVMDHASVPLPPPPAPAATGSGS